MHDGSLRTLGDVVEFYNRGGLPNPWLSPEMAPLNLTAEEQRDLISFLESLTGEVSQQVAAPPTLPAD
jgi:cytochrome c peroxidase